jgi:hypothetical protein
LFCGKRSFQEGRSFAGMPIAPGMKPLAAVAASRRSTRTKFSPVLIQVSSPTGPLTRRPAAFFHAGRPAWKTLTLV